MKLLECKQLILENLNRVKTESSEYAGYINAEVQSFVGKPEYKDVVEFYADYLNSNNRHYFTITSKDTFSNFEHASEGTTFVYSPLNDHSRPYMHRGDIVFCYRLGQFGSLDEALNVRGIYAVGFVLSDPMEIYKDQTGHNRWGVAITLPIIINKHLELRNIQMYPSTINLTPYNGNRNDALQYIENKQHYDALLSLVIARNPEKKESYSQIINSQINDAQLPEDYWKANSLVAHKQNDRETIKAEFKYYLENIARSARRTENGFNLKPTAIGSFILFLEPQKLFDYNIDKWAHIESMYDVVDLKEVSDITDALLSDPTFIKRDQVDNQGWRSGALMHYMTFIRILNYYSKIVVNKSTDNSNDTPKVIRSIDSPLQKIVYGAPGTGKSFGTDGEIKKIYPTKEDEKNYAFRTTFHPDSDYSTFVGCYKPKKEHREEVLSVHKLHDLYPSFKSAVLNRPLHRFISKYYNSFKGLTTSEAGMVFENLETDNTITAEIPKMMAAIEEIKESASITYDFVPQAFTKAYIAAWKALLSNETLMDKDGKVFIKPVFLVIEEINRGNCAQIFGDLFQLLDRDTDKNVGFSCYPIKPDTDLGNYLHETFSKEGITSDKYSSVVSGDELLLPPNLYIWATMNTSDQSLFPIDSAFKRRWDWKYVKISKGKDKNGNPLDWKLDFELDAEKNVDWYDFIVQMNKIVYKMTSSADKQMDYFFCKPDKKANDTDTDKTIISANTFVNKVVFYLWNDVFKDYAMDEGSLFKYKKDGKDEDLSFTAFFDEEGEPDAEVAKQFIANVMAWDKENKSE